MAGLASLLPGLRGPLTVMSEIPAALLAALMPGLRRPLAVTGEIPTALLTSFMPGLSRAFTVLGKIASSAAMLGFRISHRLIPLSRGLRFTNR
jgi:hypothetical protein